MIAPADQPEGAGGGILTLTNSDAPVKVSTQQRKFNVHHKKGRVLYRLR